MCPWCDDVIRHEAGLLQPQLWQIASTVRADTSYTFAVDAALRLRMSNGVKTAELNVHRGRSIMDVFEHALRGVRLLVRARQQSRRDRDFPRPCAEAPDLFVDLSREPQPTMPHDRRRVDQPGQITMSEMLAAMMRAGRSLAEKKAVTRRVKRTRKRK